MERGADPEVAPWQKRLLSAARSMTTPLLPDDYLELMNPLWSTRELRGRVVAIRSETEDACTVVVKPSFEWPGHLPGQYLRIGVEIDGVRHWRAYSITSDPDHPDGLLSVTIKHVPEGKLSPYFTREMKPETVVYLGGVEGTFTLPEPLPDKLFFLSAGSGITPIWAMVRELARQSKLDDVVHIHGVREPEHFIFGDTLRKLAEENEGYTLIEHLSGKEGRITPDKLDDICSDWREREAFISGPRELLDALEEHWANEADEERLSMERFQPVIGEDDVGGEGGSIRFRVTEVEAEAEPGQPILVAGEEAGGTLPYGCRMGICHTCVGKLCEGKVRDLRTGEVSGEEGQMIRTCVNAPEGHVEIDL